MTMANLVLFVGIDAADTSHEICAMNAEGTRLFAGNVPQTVAGIEELMERLLALANGEPGAIGVAIEVNHGPVVEAFVLHGFCVFALNPKQLDRFRDRFSPAGSKNDALDALVLADSLRTDGHLFRQVDFPDDAVLELRGLVDIRSMLTEQLRAHANQLRSVLARNVPGLLELAPAADQPVLWDVTKKLLSGNLLRLPRRSSFAKILKQHRIRRMDPDTLYQAVKSTLLLRISGAQAADIHKIRSLLPILQIISQELKDVETHIKSMLEQMVAPEDTHEPVPESPESHSPRHRYSDAAIIASCVGVGPITLATLITKAWSPIAGRDLKSLRALCGVAPVTDQSGKTRTVKMRYACSRDLRHAIQSWALAAVRVDPRAKQHYRHMRDRGHNHNRAVRGVIDRMLAVLIAMLRDNTIYDPARRANPTT